MPLRIPFGYRRLPADPAPQTLAEQLKEANVARKASRRIDDFERIQTSYNEHRKAQIKLCIGAFGLMLGTAPAVPGAWESCRDDGGWGCALRLGAMTGAFLAFGVTLWNGWDLSRNPVHFRTQTAKLSQEMARAMQCRTGQVAVDNLFQRYLSFDRDERAIFKAHLHEAAGEPKRSTQLWHQAADALGVS